MRLPLAWILSAGVGLTPAFGRADDSQELVTQAVSIHTSSLEALIPFHAKVTSHVILLDGDELPDSVKSNRAAFDNHHSEGQVWKSGSRLRLMESNGELGRTNLVKDLSTRQAYFLPDVKNKDSRGGIIAADYQLTSYIDISDGYLFCLPRPVPPDYQTYVSLQEAVTKARKVTARREKLDDVETVKLDLDMAADGSRFEVWLATGANYLFKKIVNHPRGKRGAEITILDYAEVKPGVFCPTRGERILRRATKETLTITDIRAGTPIPDSVFDTRLPPGW